MKDHSTPELPEVKPRPYTPRRIALYALLQTSVLLVCWGWFAFWWWQAYYFHLDQIEWWLLFGTSFAGLFGLRPNLERAIDAAWIGKQTNKLLVEQRIAQLRPVKRRIDLAFSVVLIILLAALLAVQGTGLLQGSSPGGQ